MTSVCLLSLFFFQSSNVYAYTSLHTKSISYNRTNTILFPSSQAAHAESSNSASTWPAPISPSTGGRGPVCRPMVADTVDPV